MLHCARLQTRDQLTLFGHHAHSASTTARGSFHDQRKSNFLRGLCGIGRSFYDAIASGNDGQARRGNFLARAIFFAHQANQVRTGADERDVRSDANFGEVGILGKKSVARMNRVHVGDFRGADNVRNIQIAFAAARRADADGLVGKAHVQRIVIGFGINGDGGEFRVPCRRR